MQSIKSVDYNYLGQLRNSVGSLFSKYLIRYLCHSYNDKTYIYFEIITLSISPLLDAKNQ